MKWRWVRADVVHAIHDAQLAEHGGPPGVRNEGALESALARPRNKAAYGKADAAALAAAFAFGLVRNHPFLDGNKRTGWVVARVFLADNGYRLQFDPTEAVPMVEALAGGKFSEGELAAWLRVKILKS